MKVWGCGFLIIPSLVSLFFAQVAWPQIDRALYDHYSVWSIFWFNSIHFGLGTFFIIMSMSLAAYSVRKLMLEGYIQQYLLKRFSFGPLFVLCLWVMFIGYIIVSFHFVALIIGLILSVREIFLYKRYIDQVVIPEHGS